MKKNRQEGGKEVGQENRRMGRQNCKKLRRQEDKKVGILVGGRLRVYFMIDW